MADATRGKGRSPRTLLAPTGAQPGAGRAACVVFARQTGRVHAGQSCKLEFVVRDKEYAPRESLRTSVTLTLPDEQEALLPVEESIQETGLYAAEFTPDTPGLYKVNLNAINDKDEIIGAVEEAVLVEPDHREYQLAQYNPQFLADLADHAGGKVYTLDRLAELAQSIPLPRREDADTVLLHLWHLPGFYIALVLAMALEWYLRRRKGYA